MMLTFDKFKKNCVNSSEIILSEGIKTEKDFDIFYDTKVNYSFPSKKVKFKLVSLTPGEYSPIDLGLCKTIEHLNSRGYITKYCCEGHPGEKGRGEYLEGYIFFGSLSKEKLENLTSALLRLALSGKLYVLIEPGPLEGEIIFRFITTYTHEESMKRIENELCKL